MKAVLQCWLLCIGAATSYWPASVIAQIGDAELRPFVVGVLPVVGPGGAVGGVSIDARGAVSVSTVEAHGRLREARLRALMPIDSDVAAVSPLRKISLRRLIAALDQQRIARKPIGDTLQNLAGLTRVEYVFAYPEQQDIVLAGPAEGWRVDNERNVVGRISGQPVLQLDDLIVALRTAKAATSGRGISCSIDPTEEGLNRLKPLLKDAIASDALVHRLEQALGAQQITVTGVPPGSHFAQVMVAADFRMKRLGMNFEHAPIEGLPSYMELLAVRTAARPKNAMPRWWLAAHYEPLLKDEAGLAWQLKGGGVKVMTEDGYLSSSGAVVNTGREDPLAKKWADSFSSHYAELAKSIPVFAELRNCIDLAVVAALLVKEDLPAKTGCNLSLLLDERRTGIAEHTTPKTIDSRASLVRKGRDWIISLSGGVQVDSWSALDRTETAAELSQTRSVARATDTDRWWWD
jgi:uncharacterized protein DUF1598